MKNFEVQKPIDYFRVAWQSGLAAGLFLGLPAGLLLWLILFRASNPTPFVDSFIELLQVNGLNKIFLLAFCSLGWSFSLGKISGYHPWWRIGVATMSGIVIGWFSPLSNLDAFFGDRLAVHTLYAVSMCGLVLSVTSCVSLAYGFILRNIKAGLTMALTTSFVSLVAFLLTIILFDQSGIRVGMGNFAMSRVTVTGLLASALTGGAMLGLGFSWFVREENYQAAVKS